MTRGRRKKKTPNKLLDALRLISAAQRKIGSIEQIHCRFWNKWLVASNGIISAAHPIDENLQICPNTYNLIAALEQAPEVITTFTLLPENKVRVQSGDFQAIVSCIEPNQLPAIAPDNPITECSDKFFTALESVGVLVADGAEKIINAAIIVANGTALTSNGSLILESWHGVQTPQLLVPKSFVTALSKWKSKAIYQLGWSTDSLTAWYEDGSWLKTQLYAKETPLPNLYRFLNVPTNPSPVPDNLFAAAKRLEAFSEDGYIMFTHDGAKVVDTIKSTYAQDFLGDVPEGLQFSIKGLNTIQPYVKTIHFNALPGITIFFGENIRGAIANRKS